ncbi:MAG: hypothetical protein GVY04_10285 [Cyanobacteria bacterium]|nr:hypothetical protein [Cyanobacteria bacterium GSL.Bin1]
MIALPSPSKNSDRAFLSFPKQRSRFSPFHTNSDRAPLSFLNTDRAFSSFPKTTIALFLLPQTAIAPSPLPKNSDRASLLLHKNRSRSPPFS